MTEFHLNVDGKGRKLTPDNCGIAMFRDEPDKDYLDIWEEKDGEEAHTWIFGRREMLIWMGRVCIQRGDDKILRQTERDHEPFREHTGWNPTVYVEDVANETENEIFISYLLNDLDKVTGPEDIPA